MQCFILVLHIVVLMMLNQVLAAPRYSIDVQQRDSIEQELVRQHHATAGDTAQPGTDDILFSDEATDDVADDDFRNTSDQSDDSEDQTIDDEDLYDITVGDVIYDVLLTLRDHPEIVRELIASEKAKLTKQIETFNAITDDNVDTMSGFRLPAQQLQNVPKNIEKKAGRSGMPVLPEGAMSAQKRQSELTNDAFTESDVTDESHEYMRFLDKPREGGEREGKFNYQQFISESESSESTDDSTSSSSSSESDDSTEEIGTFSDETHDFNDNYKFFGMPYNMAPFGQKMGGYRLQRQYGQQKYAGRSGSSESSTTDESTDDTSDTSSSDTDSKEDVSQLSHLGKQDIAVEDNRTADKRSAQNIKSM